MIDIRGLSRSAVLAALYNASRPQGLGFLHYDAAPMTIDEAQRLLTEGTYFDYLKGRVMKVDLRSDESFEERLYDRDNGDGAAAAVVTALRNTSTSANVVTETIHQRGVKDGAVLARDEMNRNVETQREDGMTVVRLGLADLKTVLEPAVKRAAGEED